MPKPIQRPKQNSIKDIYAVYAAKLLEANPTWWSVYGKELAKKNCYIYANERGKKVLKMSWQLWKAVVISYYKAAKDAIIRGEVLQLGSNLGKIRAVRIERNFSKLKIDWVSTFTQKLPGGVNGKYMLIYHTSEDYCKIEWEKSRDIPNMPCYNFNPPAKSPGTKMGFKGEFSAALVSNPLLKYRYKFIPVVKKHIVQKQIERAKKCNTPTQA